MFGIGSSEFLVILVVALLVLGPSHLPKIAKTLGKAMGEFRRVSTEFQRTLNLEADKEEHEELKKQAQKEFFNAEAPPATPAPQAAAVSPDKTAAKAEAAPAQAANSASPAENQQAPSELELALAATREQARGTSPVSAAASGDAEKPASEVTNMPGETASPAANMPDDAANLPAGEAKSGNQA